MEQGNRGNLFARSAGGPLSLEGAVGVRLTLAERLGFLSSRDCAARFCGIEGGILRE